MEEINLLDFTNKVPCNYWKTIIFFDFDIKKETWNKKNTFPTLRSLISYLEDNKEKNIYFTLDKVDNFEEDWNNMIVNYHKYDDFCRNIWKSWKNKIQAFFTKKLRNYTIEEEKKIRLWISEHEIIEKINNAFSEIQNRNIFNELNNILGQKNTEQQEQNSIKYTNDDILEILKTKNLSFLKSILTNENIIDFLKNKNWEYIIKSFLENHITEKDIINIWYRKEQLSIFKKLLDEELKLEDYRNIEYENNLDLCEKYWLTERSIWEKIWQYFFQKNNWIFWYWLDYRFMWIIQREADLSTKTVWWREAVNWDFLVWDNNYVHFVELKLPDTPLFWKDKNRSNSWKLSDELFNAKSQILEQKASWLVKLYQKHSEEDKDYNKIEWKSYDSKVILIIWNIDKELEKSIEWAWIKEIKRKTFELFRNDSKNVEIITYKELYDRSEFLLKLKD